MVSRFWLARGMLGLAVAVLVLAGCGAPSALPQSSAVTLGPTSMPASPEAAPTSGVPATAAAPPATATLGPTATPVPPALTSPPKPAGTAARPAGVSTPEHTAEPSTASPAPRIPAQPPTITPRPSEPAVVAGPVVVFFHVTPTTTLDLGDSLAMSWEAAGQKAELCPISGPGPVETRCRDVPLTGSTHFATDEEAMTYVGFGLRVTGGGSSIWSVVDVHLQCQDLRPWFFDGPPLRCPADLAHESPAAGQYFERGLMVWIQDPDSFYVFYRGKDEQGFQTFDWVVDPRQKPGASPDRRVGEQPPAGLYEPVSGFGMLWRGEIEGVGADVRQRLGWAVEPEFGFDTSYQCETTFYPGLWSCFLRGPRGEILALRPDSTAQVRWLWEERRSTP